MAVLKNIISPIQMWLLSQGKCAGCGRNLSEGKHKKHKKGEQVICACGRIYIKGGKKGDYRRALFEEV